jgi:hypothetical protein
MTLTDRLLRLALVLAFSSLVVLGCLVARAAMEFRDDYEARVCDGVCICDGLDVNCPNLDGGAR